MRDLALKKFVILTLAFYPSISFAGTGFNLGNIASIFGSFDLGTELCRFFHCFISDSVVLVISTLAIFFLGIGVFFAKVNWGLAVSTAIGIILISSAEQIAQIFVPGANCQGFFQSLGLNSGAVDFLMCNNLLPTI